jgi:prepilin-type processing-associated H-X9-DG protein
LALDGDSNGRWDTDGFKKWFAEQVGRPDLGWICPDAPIDQRALERWPDSQRVGGHVDSAWVVRDWGFVAPCYASYPQGYYIETSPKFRAGSYTWNQWLFESFRASYSTQCVVEASIYTWVSNVFENENQLAQPTFTPVLGDSSNFDVAPTATAPPATDLWQSSIRGPYAPSFWTGWIYELTIPRHGNRPQPVPREWPAGNRLPGAINVSFYDGHGELVPLERLWQLYWHRNYEPPAKRPGLQ